MTLLCVRRSSFDCYLDIDPRGDIIDKVVTDITSSLADIITGFMTDNTRMVLVVISPSVLGFASNK